MTQEAISGLRKQVAAAVSLIATLREMGEGDDAELIADTVEGETALHEAVGRVVDQIDECEALIAGIEAKENQFSARRLSFEKRRELLKAAVERAMVEAETPTIRLPTATVFLSKRAPGVVIETEADVPSEFWTQPQPPEPRIDKAALKAALKAGQAVPGARLDNGSVSLSVRR